MDISQAQLDYLGGLYKAEVAGMDDYVGELIRLLEDRGLTDNTLIIFTSDHGEELNDHKSIGHGHTVYDELLRVPLIMRLDGVLPARVRVAQPVDLIDLSPTVLDLLGLEIPESMQGQSMLLYIEDPAAPAKTTSLASSARPFRFALRHGDWKLVRHNTTGWLGKHKVELCDLARDPMESNDVSQEHPVVVEALRQLLAWHLERDQLAGEAPAEAAILDEQSLESLRALGYLAE